MTAKEQVKAVLGITPKDEGTKVLKLVDVNEALSQIEEIVMGVIGNIEYTKLGEHQGMTNRDMNRNGLRTEQLKRWSDK